MDSHPLWREPEKDDKGLMKDLEQLLTARVSGNPYSDDGSFARSISLLPPGLKAMAATHWLDISLTLDSMALWKLRGARIGGGDGGRASRIGSARTCPVLC